MIADNVLLQMSSNVYRRDDVNTAPVPVGWEYLTEGMRVFREPDGKAGFSAGAFVSTATNEIVISFTGTQPGIVDWSRGNFPAASGAFNSQQIEEAIKFVSDVMATAAAQGKTITFTGHSLGGGLASLMATFFGMTGRTFDSAPFEFSAVNVFRVKDYFRAYSERQTELNRQTSAAFGSYSAAASNASQLRTLFDTRQALVSELHLSGEVLSLIRYPETGIYGATSEVDIKGSTLYMQAMQAPSAVVRAMRSVELHSIDLLTVLNESAALRSAANGVAQLLELMVSPNLYGGRVGTSRQDFVAHLLRYELGGVVSGTSFADVDLATRFGNDAGKLVAMITANSLGVERQIQAGVIGTLIDFYQAQTSLSADFIQSVTGGVQFDAARLPSDSTDRLGLTSLIDLVTVLSDIPDRPRVRSALGAATLWTVQGGSTALSSPGGIANDALIGSRSLANVLSGGGGKDILVGGSGDDTLNGGDGNDTLIGTVGLDVLNGNADSDYLSGGEGQDVLNGGTGVDELYGGDDFDTYNFVTGDWYDTIEDSDGQGQVVVNGVTVLAGAAVANNVWLSADGQLRISRQLYESAGDARYLLTIRDSSASISILIRNWADGDLGITLGSAADPVQQSPDLYAGNFPSGTTGESLGLLDNLLGSSNADRIFGLAGNDVLIGRAGGDEIFGGEGSDALIGGSGRDSIYGGENHDLIFGDWQDNQTAGVLYGSPSEPFSPATPMLVAYSGYGWGVGWNASQQFPVSDWRDAGTRLDGVTYDLYTYQPGDGDMIDAGDGDDEVFAGDGDDVVYGGAGADRLYGLAGGDLLEGGIGNDWLYGDSHGDATDGVPIYNPVYSATNLGGSDRLVGGEGNDCLYGQGGGDFLYGDTGDDVIYGDDNRLTSATWLRGTPMAQHGIDYIEGGDGNDWIDGGGAADTIQGGIGNDTIWGDGVSVADGFEGKDFVDGGAGDDAIAGGGAADRLLGGDGNDLVYGDGDTLSAAIQGDDSIDGGLGNDTLIGGGGNDTLVGGDGADQLWGDQGTAGLAGESNGSDQIVGGLGVDQLIGGGGVDTLIGGDGNDVIHGDDETSRVAGSFHGADTLDGGEGNDWMGGWGGADTLMGGNGNDQLYGDHSTLGAGFHGDDFLDGGAGEDKLYGQGGNDTLYGGSARDELNGGEGADVLDGGTGGDVISGDVGDDTLRGATGSDSLLGGDGNDKLYGNEENDSLTGGAESDLLDGGEGDDSLSGGEGDDDLDGGIGNDALSGGLGGDTYRFGRSRGSDSISELGGVDRVLLESGIAPGDVQLHRTSGAWSAAENDLVLTFSGSGDALVIRNQYAAGGAASIESIEFADGTVWSSTQIAAHTIDISGPANIYSGTGLNDIYTVDNSGDEVSESANSGVDLIETQISYWLPSNVENMTLLGPLNADLYGNGLNNTLTGNAANNTLDGKGGADTLIGGQGDDTYYVDSALINVFVVPGWSDDVVVEQTDEGYDTVVARAWSVTLTANVETLRAIDAQVYWYDWYTSTDRRRWMVGNDLNNVIDTTAAHSGQWYGAEYIEHQFVLDGGGGADTLIGGNSSDTYVVDDLNDAVLEYGVDDSGEQVSIDAVQSSVAYTLSGNIENLTLIGTASVNGSGNALNNILSGAENSGANELRGGYGDDTYVLGANDTAVEAEGEGIDTVVLSTGVVRTYLMDEFANFENLELGSSNMGASNLTGNDISNRLVGNELNNVLQGGDGDDYVDGGAGTNVLYGGSGNDELISRGLSDTLDGGSGNDTLRLEGGTSSVFLFDRNYGNDTITQTAQPNGIVQFAAGIAPSQIQMLRNGKDLIFQIAGDTGSLTVSNFFFSESGYSNGEFLSVAFADGTIWGGNQVGRRVQATLENAAPTNGNDVLGGTTGDDIIDALNGMDYVFGGSGNDTIRGGASQNYLYGDEGDDTLDSTGGNSDTMVGGTGNDTYIVDNIYDIVLENAGSGTDLVQATVTYTLSANTEALTLIGTSATNGTGNALANTLIGNSANNTLSGAVGADSMQGAAGDDVYIVENVGDAVTENAGEGNDAVQSSVSYTLSDNVESLTLTTSASISGTGNAQANTITGNNGSNVLNGGAGADTLIGGTGNDTYVVDDAGDVVTEAASAGTDLVQASIDYTLSVNVENLTLTGTASINATGNSAGNVLTGNSGNNYIDGGTGNDTMHGGAGNDIFIVNVSGDVVNENASEGIDEIRSLVTRTLTANIENLVLTGSSGIGGTGNVLGNILTGNAGNNALSGGDGNDTLNGGAGTDSMTGGLGNDIFIVDVSADTTSESAGQGIDTVQSAVTRTLSTNIELLFLTGSAVGGTGNTLSNLVRGNAIANTLAGGTGIDILEGGAGNDTLSNTTNKTLLNGGADADTLTGTAANDLLIGGTGNDSIATGTGADIILFNKGDGQDTVAVSTTKDNTLSVGGAVYADLVFQKSGNNLVLQVGATDQITFTNYYSSTSNRSVNTLQVIIEGTTEYVPGSGTATQNKKIQSFNFDGLVTAFDNARAANPNLTSWALTNALVVQHLSASDTAALGGDLSYYYGRLGTLSDLSFTPAAGILGASTFGSSAQTLASPGTLQDSSARLS